MPSPDLRVPELIGGVDIRRLPLTAIDGFVLSRIDGRSTLSEIIAMTGLAAEQVTGILDKLVELGAIRMPEAVTSEPRQPARGGAKREIRPDTEPAPQRTPAPPRPSVPVGRPHLSSAPPRRRPSYGTQPRRLFSESSISGPPPPDMRSLSQRPRASTPARPHTPVPPGSSQPPARGRESEQSPRSAPPLHGSTPDSGAPPVGRGASLPPGPDSAFESARPTQQRSLLDSSPAHDSDAHTTGPRAPQISILPTREGETSSPAVLYDPRELEEEVDLTADRRKQILDMFYRLPTLNYYGVLGVREGSEKKDIRAAYFALSKQFHPDSMFRKELGTFKAKMTTVFQALTEAYETLSKKKARDEYDRYLRSTRSAQEAERALATDAVAQADGQVEVPRPPPLPTTDYAIPTPTPVPTAPREVSADARRIARELLERRLRGGAARPPPDSARVEATRPSSTSKVSSVPSIPPIPSVPPGPASSAPIDRQQLARQLGRTLIDVSKITGSGDKVARAVSGARSAFERGDIASSVQHMARAFSLAPERADLHAEYDRLSQMLAQKLASDYEEQARFEVKQGKWAAAAVSWAKVCEGRPDDPSAHRAAALALLKAGGDLRGAQKYAQRAVYLAPDDIDGRILLAQTYLTVGLKLNARRELDAAAKLDPSNEMVKNLLSDLKG